MPQAQITINAVIGSNTDLPINQIVQLNNTNIGGEISFLWEIIDQPAGVSDILSNPVIQNPTFTPKKEGTYLIRLTVNQGLPDQDIDNVVAAILQLKTRKRVPAAGEQTEASSSRGWAVDTNDYLRFLTDAAADTGTVVGANLDASPITRGNVVRATGTQTIKSGLPGQEDVPGFTPALATVGGNVDELLLVAEGDIDGNTSIPVGGLGVFRWLGRFAALALGSGAVGDSVFVSDIATISLTPGTNRRQIGNIMAVFGVNRDIWVAGTLGGENAPIDPAYVVFGNPGTLPNANRIDGLLATGAINNIPYTFRAADVTTVALVAKRFSAAGADIFQAHDESGTVLSRLRADGSVDVNAPRDGALVGTATSAGDGIKGVGNTAGVGVRGTGGSTNGTGVQGTGGPTNGVGVRGTGQGSGSGMQGDGGPTNGFGVVGTGGGTAEGLRGLGGPTNGKGIQGLGTGTAPGVAGIGGPTSGIGVTGTGGTTDGKGVQGLGTGTAPGVAGIGGATGAGVLGTGGSSGGVGVVGAGTTGNVGVSGTGQGAAAGVSGTGGSTNGIGVEGVGNGIGVGVKGQGGPTGIGVEGVGNGGGVKGTGTSGSIGVEGTGAATGSGVKGTGGGSNGSGVIGTGGSTNGIGVQGAGNGAGSGVIGTGGSTSGIGVQGAGGSTNGIGVRGTGTGSGSGVIGAGGDSDGTGVTGTGGSTNSIGVKGTGGGTGAGVDGIGAGTGSGVKGTGGTSSGIGVEGVGGTINGTGVGGTGTGTGTGVEGIGGTTGHGVVAQADITSPVRSAFRIVPQDADPTTLADGDIWYNSTVNKFRGRAGGVTVDFH